MKKLLLALSCLLLLSITVQAQLLWDKVYGTATNTQTLNRMIPLANGGYLLVGDQYVPGPLNLGSTLTIRTNANGDTLWTRKYQAPGCNAGTINDAAEDLDGNLILIGYGVKVGANDENGFVMKLNPNGDTIWTKKLITPQKDGYYNVIIGNDSTYLLNGKEAGTSVIKKISKKGVVKWTTPLVFSPTDAGFITNLSKGQNGYFVFIGSLTAFPAKGKTINLSEAGIALNNHMNFASQVYDVFTRPNNNLIACSDARLYEFNSSGDTLWSKIYKINTQFIELTAARSTTDGNYITVFDRRNGNDGDVGLMKVSPNGTAIKDTVLFRFGYNEYSKDIAVDVNGDYVFAGNAEVSSNRSHIFLAKHRKWRQTLGVKEANQLSFGIKLYPNPATEQIILESEQLLSGTITLFNLQGQQVWKETVTKTAEKVIPLQTLPPGIYMLNFQSENGSFFSKKVVKQ